MVRGKGRRQRDRLLPQPNAKWGNVFGLFPRKHYPSAGHGVLLSRPMYRREQQQPNKPTIHPAQNMKPPPAQPHQMTSTPLPSSIDPMTPATLQPDPLRPVTGEQGITIPELEGIGRLSPDAYAIANVLSGSLSRFADRLELLHAEAILQRQREDEAARLRNEQLIRTLYQIAHSQIVGNALIPTTSLQSKHPGDSAAERAEGIADVAEAITEPPFHDWIKEQEDREKVLTEAAKGVKDSMEALITAKGGAR